MQYFVGLDWASRERAVCVVDERGTVTVRFTAAHTDEGLTELVTRLARFGAPAELRVAIERPSGLVVGSSSSTPPTAGCAAASQSPSTASTTSAATTVTPSTSS